MAAPSITITSITLSPSGVIPHTAHFELRLNVPGAALLWEDDMGVLANGDLITPLTTIDLAYDTEYILSVQLECGSKTIKTIAIPSECLPPTDLTVAVVQTGGVNSGISVNFTPAVGVTNYIFEVWRNAPPGDVGAVLVGSYNAIGVFLPAVIQNALLVQENVNYYLRARSNCRSAGLSEWTDIVPYEGCTITATVVVTLVGSDYIVTVTTNAPVPVDVSFAIITDIFVVDTLDMHCVIAAGDNNSSGVNLGTTEPGTVEVIDISPNPSGDCFIIMNT